MSGLFWFGSGLALFIFSIIVHEFGHWLAFAGINKRVNVRVYFKSIRRFGLQTGEPKDYVDLKDNQKFGIYGFGIIAGLIPIMIAGQFNEFYYLILVGYILGSMSDIEKMWKLRHTIKLGEIQ